MSADRRKAALRPTIRKGHIGTRVKRSTLLWITILTLVAATIVRLQTTNIGKFRGVALLDKGALERPAPFDLAQSAALFVGVREFDDKTIAKVPYACDDPVDLAYEFAMEPRGRLVRPDRVVLALAGTPRKAESRKRLGALRDAGAVVTGASRDEILEGLRKQSAAAGPGGLLLLSFATHGFSREGTPYVLASNSLLGDPQTALPTTSLFDTAARSRARRSLIFVDACRDRILAGARTGEEPATAAPVIEAMTDVEGQVVFYAAAAGRYAYDDFGKRNGVFTAAVLEGLQCKASTDARGLVTVDTLQAYVEKRVRSWVEKNRKRAAGGVIQVVMDGETKRMPLSVCKPSGIAGSIFTRHKVSNPDRVARDGSSVEAFGENGASLWRRRLPRRVDHAVVADLDGDGRNEVVAGAGELFAFNADGKLLWSRGGGNGVTVHRFVAGRIFRGKDHQIVALSAGGQRGAPSLLSIFDGAGRLLSTYSHPGPLRDVQIAALTARHAPKIIVTGANDRLQSVLHVKGSAGSVFMLDPRDVRGEAPPYRGNLGTGTQLWYGAIVPGGLTIDRLTITDRNNDGQRDLTLHTSAGDTFYLDFEGQLIGRAPGVHFELIAK